MEGIKFTFLSCGLFVLSLLSGCSGLDRFLIQNDAVGATQYLESQGQNCDSVETKMKYWLSHGYAELRQYKEFNKCFEDFENSILNGEMTIASAEAMFGYKYTFNVDWTTADINTLKARIAFEFGQYQKAVNLAEPAFKAITEGSPSCCMGMSAGDRRALLDEHIHTRGIMAISYWYLNQPQKSDYYLNELKNFKLGFTEKSWQKQLKAWTAKAYLARNDYRNAYHVLVNEPFDLDILGGINSIMQYEPVTATFHASTGHNWTEWEYLQSHQYQVMVCHTLSKLEQYQSSNECYSPLLNDPRIERFGDLNFIAHKDMGSNFLKLESLTEAENHLSKAIELIESQRSSILFDTQKLGFTEGISSVYYDMVSTQLAQNQPEKAFEFAERGKSRALIDMLASKQDFGTNQNTLNTIQDIELNTLDITRPTATSTRSVRGLKRKLQSTAPNLASLVAIESSEYKELIGQLTENETLIEYFGDESTMVAFVITKDSITARSLNLTNINKEITQYRRALIEPNSNKHLTISQRLYEQLIAPIAKDIDTERLTIVPHSNLHYLPFASLFDGNQYLIDQYSLRVLPSISVLQYISTKPSNNTYPLLALGNPDLNEEALSLPAAEKEAIRLAQQTPGSKLLIKEQATESAFSRLSPTAKRIHIASHGQFDTANPLNSRLLLTKDASNDGNLTVSDIYTLKLNADLVTLSACETGLGELKGGDDVIGLNRGFLYAGARSIVSSLWVVDDQATADLMTLFYSQLDTAAKQDALRNAQLKVKEQHSHPFYWAAFQVTGLN